VKENKMQTTKVKTSSAAIFAIALLVIGSAPALAQQAGSKAPVGAAPKSGPGGDKSDQLDVSGLEKKYWAAKDTDFSVVQNRTYSKVGRFALSPSYGFLINDPYSDGPTFGLSGQYFFTERYGIEVMATHTMSKDNTQTSAFQSRYQAIPDHNKISDFAGVGFNWVPFYAKMSVLNSTIIYFDMAITPGFGVSRYEQQVLGGNVNQTAPTAFINVTQHYFLNKNFALRIDYENRWFNENVALYATDNIAAPGVAAGSTLRSDLNHTSLLLFGFDFFF
jgi:outer membrane beta-barrel protein